MLSRLRRLTKSRKLRSTRPLPHQRRATLGLAIAMATLALACQPSADGQAIPLYPSTRTTRLPPSQLAQLSGPIAKIDGSQVIDDGRPFELLPGCHLVEMQRLLAVNGVFVRRTGYGPPLPVVIYALRMRAGSRYVIRPDSHLVRGVNDPVFLAREEQSNGTASDLMPVKSSADINACQGWETAVLRSDSGRAR